MLWQFWGGWNLNLRNTVLNLWCFTRWPAHAWDLVLWGYLRQRLCTLQMSHGCCRLFTGVNRLFVALFWDFALKLFLSRFLWHLKFINNEVRIDQGSLLHAGRDWIRMLRRLLRDARATSKTAPRDETRVLNAARLALHDQTQRAKDSKDLMFSNRSNNEYLYSP